MRVYSKLKLPLNKSQCKTCPFGPKSDPEVRFNVTERISTQAMQICHGTEGPDREPKSWCAGARELQLKIACARGMIQAPTEKAWEQACAELNLEYPVDKE